MSSYWYAAGSLYAPDGEDDADALDGVHPLPGMTLLDLLR